MSPEIKSKSGENFIIFAMIFLTAFIVAVVTYSIYLFIDITKVSSAANVHLTKNLLLATKNAQGKLYSNPANGIKDWLVYTDEKNGYEIKYPNDLIFEEGSRQEMNLITLKKVIKPAVGFATLSSAIYAREKGLSGKASMKEEIKQLGINWNDSWKQELYGGKPGIRTGEIKDETGVIKDMVIWQFGDKIFVLESDCFKASCKDEQILFDKIISEFKFI